MKKILRRFLPILLLVCIDFTALSPGAQGLPPDMRRNTLFVEIGQKKLRLEAPENMCFLDRTLATQEIAYGVLSGIAERNNDQVLMAVFMNCADANNPNIWSDGLPDFGFMTWMNPSIGEITPMNRQDYLDMREASFPQYAKSRAAGFSPDKIVHRNKDNVSLGMTGEEDNQGLKRKSTAILSTTVLRHIPVEITLHYAGDALPKLKELYPLMDKLTAQQIALNE